MIKLSAQAVCYVLSEEALGLSAYKDSVGVWTWAGGIATTSGFNVEQYKDKPQSIAACLRATVDMINAKFLPPLIKAFSGTTLADHQLAAALSFVWRNGPDTLSHAEWVKHFLAGEIAQAKIAFMQWTDHGQESDRAARERDLFFDAQWPKNMHTRVFTATAPHYTPIGGYMVNLAPYLQTLLGAK